MNDKPPLDAALLRIAPGLTRDRPYQASLHPAGQGNAPPLAVVELGPMPYERLKPHAEAFLAGDPAGAVGLGETLARWLFGTAEEEETAALNAIGEALARRPAPGTSPGPVRLAVALHTRLATATEFLTLPLSLLDHNTWLPVTILRGLDGTGAVVASPAGAVGRMRVLLVHANPNPGVPPDYKHLPQLPELVRLLHRTLDPLIHDEHLIHVEERTDPTAAVLKEQLRQYKPHVLIYLGHGYKTRAGGLVCVKGGAPDFCPFPDLVAALGERPALRLAVLIACHSHAAAPLLLKAGVPAVEAMEQTFPVAGVPAFADAFLGGLARLEPLVRAHDAARRAMAASDHPEVVVGSALPALWLAGPDDQLFVPPEQRFRASYRDGLFSKGLGTIPFPGGAVPLASAYVERTVVREVKEKVEPTERGGPDPGRDGDRLRAEAAKEVIRQVPVDLLEALASMTRVVVEAPAWIGKSTLCRWVLNELLRPGSKPGPPIFLVFRDWAEWFHLHKKSRSFGDYCRSVYLGTYLTDPDPRVEVRQADGSTAAVPAGGWLYDEWTAGRAVLIVDGLDEVYDETRRAEALAALTTDADPRSQARVLLTTRPVGLGGVRQISDEANRITLKELDRAGIERLATACGRVLRAPDRAADFLDRLLKPDATSAFDTARRPGLLVRMVDAFVTKGVFLTAREEVLDDEVEERLKTVRVTFEPPLSTDEPQFKRAVLEELAFHLLFCRTDLSPDETEMLRLVRHVMGEVRDRGKDYRAYAHPPSEAKTLLAELVQNSGMLQKVTLAVEEARKRGVSADAPCYQFETAELQQFLAACHLKRCLEPDGPTRAELDPPGHAPGLRAWLLGTNRDRFRCPHCQQATELEPFSWYLDRTAWHDVVVWLGGVLDDSSALLVRLGREPDDVARLKTRLHFRVLARSRKVDSGLVHRSNEMWQRSIEERNFIDLTASLARLRVREHVAIDGLLRMAEHHEDGSTRGSACRALGALADPRAVEPLLCIAEHHANQSTRMSASKALVAISRATGRVIHWKR